MATSAIVKVSFRSSNAPYKDVEESLAEKVHPFLGAGYQAVFKKVGPTTFVCSEAHLLNTISVVHDLLRDVEKHADELSFLSITIAKSPERDPQGT